MADAGTETNANLHHELYYHFLGTDQSEDILCWRDPENPKHMFGGSVTEDGKVLFLSLLCSCVILCVHKIRYVIIFLEAFSIINTNDVSLFMPSLPRYFGNICFVNWSFLVI